ncbi:transcriptional regulator [Pseudoclavibacter endophyticus]|uniref:Helix-turn-helix transcriptional regulator n=1 Tax=Pseudoclavibacter endophyticus TaxID=1778590 RepID=A0A6H9WRX6_9MICO|nr:helix-turn-helix transcriptional regulator [Pseudoclavibacter endophyticus]KAB1649687.1 helix-turn-helix transcriptional regulator [Pseudoclavibacter endophyticus]GGA60576.1 transcriptional regulator [Pseudoclavibacter endophyticus]
MDRVAGAHGAAPSFGPRVVCHLDRLLDERQLSLAELARRVDMSVVNLSILKNGRAKAVRFETMTRLCRELGCQPGDLFSVEP